MNWIFGAHNLTRRSQANKRKDGQHTVCKEFKKQDGAQVIHRLDDLQCEVPARNNQCVTPTAEEDCKMVVGEEAQACLQESKRASQYDTYFQLPNEALL